MSGRCVSYFDGLAGALCSTGVVVSHIRFGFVDIKLAKARFEPFMVTRESDAPLRTLRVVFVPAP